MSKKHSQEVKLQASSTKRTPLFELHQKLGAKIVPFAGYDMPLQYAQGIIHEHNHCRNHAVLFDVSHMGQIKMVGQTINMPAIAAVLEKFMPSPLQELKPYRQRYSVIMNEKAGILDDLMISNYDNFFMAVVNASNKDNDFAIIRNYFDGTATVELLEDRALLALQGVSAGKVLAKLAPQAAKMLFMDARPLKIGTYDCLVTRSGYTGEDGFEISVRNEDAVALAELLLAQPEVEPAGLGARDSLRLEAGLCLHGADLNELTTPLEAGIGWIFGKRRKEEGGFLGFELITTQLRKGLAKKLVGIKPLSKMPARAHTPILSLKGEPIGEITSGSFSPTLQEPIAMGYIQTEFSSHDTELLLNIRGNMINAKVVPMPFVPHRYLK